MKGKTFKCSACDFTVEDTPSRLVAHRKAVHPDLVRDRQPRRSRAAGEPEVAVETSAAERETELLGNVCAWFDQAALDAAGYQRVVLYLGQRYGRVEEAVPFE